VKASSLISAGKYFHKCIFPLWKYIIIPLFGFVKAGFGRGLKTNDECDFGDDDGSGCSVTVKDEIALV
jgi:hypothetical protein